MKILIVNKFYYLAGGAERYLFNLQQQLEKQGHEVAIFSMADKKNLASPYSQYFVSNLEFSPQKYGFIKRLLIGLKSIYSWEAKKKIAWLLDDFQPDVVHLHSICYQLTSSIMGEIKKRNIPVVQTLHEYKLICPNQRLFNYSQEAICEKCKRHKYCQPIIQKCLKNSRLVGLTMALEAIISELILKFSQQVDLFIAPSKFLMAKCQDWGIAAKKFKQIYYPVDLANLAPQTEPGSGLLYFGRLAAEKGILTLLQAIKGLPEITLAIVGQGPQEKEIKDFIEANNLQNVILHGYKQGQELYDLIKKARLVVVPSVWYENNPNTILESFALGRPVVGANIGGIPELVQSGLTGLLFQPNEPADLQQVIKNNYNNLDLIKKMGARARSWVEKNCQPDKHLQEIISLYQGLKK